MLWSIGLLLFFVRLCIANSIQHDILSQDVYDILLENYTVTYSEALHRSSLGMPEQANGSSFWQLGASYKPFRITSNETHLCRFPISTIEHKKLNSSKELSTQETHEILARGLKLLDTLYEEVPRIQDNFFMNLFYYGKNILQAPAAEALYVYENIKRFPFFTNPEGLRQDYYMLGKWSNQSNLEGNVQQSQLMPILGPANSDPNAPSGPLTHNSKFYIQQVWENGTICDLNGIPRKTTVRVRTGMTLIAVLLWRCDSYDDVD